MNPAEHFDALHALAGLLVGLLVGITGVGGGSLMTPLLVLMFGVAPATAVGTDLLYAATTKSVGMGVHGWRNSVDWKVMRRLATGSLPAAVVTLIGLNTFIHIGKNASHVILLVLGCLLLVTAAGVLFQDRLLDYGKRYEPIDARHNFWPTVALGSLLGVLVTITSVGAGAIGVTVLLMLYRYLPVSRIVGTDIAHAVPLAFLAGAGHWLLGDVDFILLANLLIGSIPGVIIGSLVSSRAPDKWLRPALAAVLTVSGLRILLQ